MVTVFHYTPVNAKQFDGLNIDSLAGKHQKRQNFPLSKFCAIRYTASYSKCFYTVGMEVDHQFRGLISQ